MACRKSAADRRVNFVACAGGAERVARTVGDMASTTAMGDAPGVADALLPDGTDRALEELAFAVFTDGAIRVPTSAVDLLAVAFARRLLSDAVLGKSGVFQLPRSKHRAALLLAILAHLLCRIAPARLDGPVVYIGFDVDVGAQLRSLSVENKRRMRLSDGNPLSAHRLTRSGSIEPLIGSKTGDVNRSVVYFNTRIGKPPLGCNPPLVVLDGTTVATPAARMRALDWALGLGGATIIAVGDIGDDGLVQTMARAGLVPSVLEVTPGIVDELVYARGEGQLSSSSLSSAGVLHLPKTAVTMRRVVNADAEDAIQRCYAALGDRPQGDVPFDVDVRVNLLRSGMRLAAGVSDYRTACANNPRPGELPRLAALEREVHPLPPPWRGWQIAQLGGLTVGVRQLWSTLECANPKLSGLWSVLDELARSTTGPIAVRCHSRAAARATVASLSRGERTPEQEALWDELGQRVTVVTLKERLPAGRYTAQILTGAPPPWLFSILLGQEAVVTYVLCYEIEEEMLRRHAARWAATATAWQGALCRSLGVAAHEEIESPLGVAKGAPQTREWTPKVPALGILAALDSAAGLVDVPEEEEPSAAGAAVRVGAKMCTPVKLDDGRTWWCVDEHNGETPVLTLTAGGQLMRPVNELLPGDRIIVPAGEGTESLHSRLLGASRSNNDIRDLDLILTGFRSAARALLRDSATRTEAAAKVTAAGGRASYQLPLWASGNTIAPRDPGDVEAVFKAAGKECENLALIYAVANQLRSLGRQIGHFISAVVSGRGSSSVEHLRQVLGPIVDELLDEFMVVTVAELGHRREVPGSFAGRVR